MGFDRRALFHQRAINFKWVSYHSSTQHDRQERVVYTAEIYRVGLTAKDMARMALCSRSGHRDCILAIANGLELGSANKNAINRRLGRSNFP